MEYQILEAPLEIFQKVVNKPMNQKHTGFVSDIPSHKQVSL